MRKILIRFTLFFVTIMLLIMCTIFLLQYMEKKKMQKQGNELIIKIEEYRLRNKKLPENVSELGIDECEGSGPFYEKIDSTSYRVFFNIGFDDSFIYDSKIREWKY